MARTHTISPETRAYIKFKRHSDVKQLMKETSVSRAHIYKLWKEVTETKIPRKKGAGGRPQKLSIREKRRILRLVKTLRREEPNWTVKRMMARADLKDVSRRTVNRFLNKQGLKYLQARKKGLLSLKDRKKRVQFAKKVLKNQPEDFWTNKLAFYLDGVGFVYKRNPLDQALAPKGRVWRTKSEGLLSGCTSRGEACGTGGKYVKLIVAISYGKGVICAERYEKMDGKFFSEFLKANFNTMVKAAGKDSRTWVQDGDPSQNSHLAKEAMHQVRSDLFQIPPRSPDINPIENFFSLVKRALNEDAIDKKIKHETMDEFESRIKRIMGQINIDTINKIIASMNERMKLIIACKGERLKY